ncbi:unnamed protein product [Amaranthus hypochondriacus]
MLLSGKTFVSTKLSHHFFREKSQRFITTFSKKPQFSDSSDNKGNPNFGLKISNKLLAQSGIAILGLGFVDAGYSGDWSRIGVISKETEDLLKLAAFLVVPVCLFLIFFINRQPEN